MFFFGAQWVGDSNRGTPKYPNPFPGENDPEKHVHVRRFQTNLSKEFN